LKTAATVAVASSVHGRVQRRQQARWAAQDQAMGGVPAPPPPPPAPYPAPAPPQQAYAEPASPQPADTSDRLAQLKQLGELLSAGVLTQAEFEQEKARILNS
jgi:Short C-terminal domain